MIRKLLFVCTKNPLVQRQRLRLARHCGKSGTLTSAASPKFSLPQSSPLLHARKGATTGRRDVELTHARSKIINFCSNFGLLKLVSNPACRPAIGACQLLTSALQAGSAGHGR